jgi:hypothetical protein
MSVEPSEFGFLLHNLETGEDLSAATEASALAATRGLSEDQDWSLWQVRKDGTGEASLIAVGSGPVGSK